MRDEQVTAGDQVPFEHADDALLHGAIATGTGELVIVPRPSWPRSLLPQHQTWPEAIAQA